MEVVAGLLPPVGLPPATLAPVRLAHCHFALFRNRPRKGGFQQFGGALLEKLLKEVLEKLLASFAAKPETGVVAGKDWA